MPVRSASASLTPVLLLGGLRATPLPLRRSGLGFDALLKLRNRCGVVVVLSLCLRGCRRSSSARGGDLALQLDLLGLLRDDAELGSVLRAIARCDDRRVGLLLVHEPTFEVGSHGISRRGQLSKGASALDLCGGRSLGGGFRRLVRSRELSLDIVGALLGSRRRRFRRFELFACNHFQRGHGGLVLRRSSGELCRVRARLRLLVGAKLVDERLSCRELLLERGRGVALRAEERLTIGACLGRVQGRDSTARERLVAVDDSARQLR
jgi:hypothetical protein